MFAEQLVESPIFHLAPPEGFEYKFLTVELPFYLVFPSGKPPKATQSWSQGSKWNSCTLVLGHSSLSQPQLELHLLQNQYSCSWTPEKEEIECQENWGARRFRSFLFYFLRQSQTFQLKTRLEFIKHESNYSQGCIYKKDFLDWNLFVTADVCTSGTAAAKANINVTHCHAGSHVILVKKVRVLPFIWISI